MADWTPPSSDQVIWKPPASDKVIGAIKAPQPPEDPGRLSAVWQGIKQAPVDVGMGIAQGMSRLHSMLPGQPPNDPAGPQAIDKMVAQNQQAYEANPAVKAHPYFAGAGRLAGNVGMSAPLALVPGGAGAGLAARLGAATAAGAAGGVLEPVAEVKDDYWSQKAKQMALGAAGGAAAGGVGAAVGRAIAPRLIGDAATLADKGVQLTSGQMAPGHGLGQMARSVEAKLQSFPILGDFIRGGRERSLTSYNTATINQALEPIGASLPRGTTAGNDAVRTAGNAISQAYNAVLGRIPRIVVDRDMQNALKAIELDARSRPAVWQNLRGEMNSLSRKLKRGTTTGREAQLAASDLERVARGLQNSPDFFQREVARHLREVRSSIFDAIERQYPAIAPDLRSANAAWAMLTRIENAAGRRAGSNGVFTPMDLLQAVKSGAGGVRRREFARGDALMQEWAQAGQRMLPSMVPDSGTAGRLLIAELIGMGIDPLKTIAATGLATGAGLLHRGLGIAARSQPGAAQRGLRSGIEAATPALGAGAGMTAAGEKGRLRSSVVGP